jgi:scyllo-inositol 2-dehydrogenase (NADP+)
VPEVPPVRVAAIGLGWVTTNRHIPALRGSRGAHLVGLIDYQPDRAAAMARRQHLRLFATAQSAAEVPWLDEIDAVTIGTPPQTHYAVARGYLEAGKHVLVEKPMAMSRAEAQHLAAVAVDQGRVLAVVHNFLFSRSIQRVKRMIGRGRLGEITSIWAIQLSNPKRRLPGWYNELPLGLFYDEAPHSFCLIRDIAGSDPEFRSIDVLRASDHTETPTKITARLDAGGIPIQLDMNFQAPLSEWHIGVLGSRGAAFVDVFRDILVETPNDQAHLGRDILRTSAAATWSHIVGTVKSGLLLSVGRLTYGNDEVVRRFCLACQGESGALVGISAADGVAVVGMLHRVIDASK